MKKIFRFFGHERGQHEPDRQLVGIVMVILVFGLISLSSASSVVAYAKFGDAYYYFKHQLIGLSLGIISFWIFSQIDYHIWRRWAFGFLVISIALLLLVFIPGLSATYGKARSWINIFGFSLQPSEFVKISFLLYLAAWLESRRERLHEVSQGIGPFLIILGLINFLMLLQPDLGTLIIIAITSLIVYFVGGGKFSHIVLIILTGLLLFSFLVVFLPLKSSDGNENNYRLNRLKCWLNPEADKKYACYQINQSLIAVGSGGIFGRGWGASRQKYLYLPEVSGDSVFAIIAEEIGFIFSSLLILGYLFFFYRSYFVAKYAPDDFGRNLAIGIASWLVLQAIINIGGIINLMPMTGVPLPFVSYGGSAILSALTAVGILVNISRQTKI